MISHRRAAWLAYPLMAVGLFFCYLRLSRTIPVNSDGAANALQAWDMLHGNPILRGWTVTDVSFYTTELPQYAAIELFYGLQADVVHVAAAMTYTLLVLLAAFLARGHARGAEAAARMVIAALVLVLPQTGTSSEVLLLSPDHVGSGVPLLVTFIVMDRFGQARWLPWAVFGLLLWGQVGDPLITYIGVLPVILVSAFRALANRSWRGQDAQLALGAALSTVAAHLTLSAITAAGGFGAYPPPTHFASPGRWPGHIELLVKVLGVLFGTNFAEAHGPWEMALAVLHLVGPLLVAAATLIALVRIARRREFDRINAILVIAIAVNVGAFIASTLPSDLLSARQVSAVLTLGAVLAGRIVGPWIATRKLIPIAAVVLAVFAVGLVIGPHRPAIPAANQDIADWLQAKGLTHGLGIYWSSNNITLTTQGKVISAPIGSEDKKIRELRWESKSDWYDPAKSDARFLILDVADRGQSAIDEAIAQFGPPAERRDFGRHVVLVWDHNILPQLHR